MAGLFQPGGQRETNAEECFKKLEELKVEPFMAKRISKAFTQGNLEAFEELAQELLCLRAFDLELLRVLDFHLGECPNSRLEVCGLCTCFSFVDAGWQLRKERVKQRLFGGKGKLETKLTMLDINGLSSHARDMLRLAGCDNKVSHEIVEKTTELAALGALHAVAESCGKVVVALQGQADQQADFSGMQKDAAAGNERVTVEMEELNTKINHIQEVADSRIQAIAQTASLAPTWKRKLDTLRDWLIAECGDPCESSRRKPTPQQEVNKQEMLQRIEPKVKQLVASVKQDLRSCTSCEELDVKDIKKHCRQMIRALAYSPELAKTTQKAIVEAVAERDRLSEDWEKQLSKYTEKSSELQRLKEDLDILQTSHDKKMEPIEREVDEQEMLLSSLLARGVTMVGTPPEDDQTAQQLCELFKNQEVSKLTNYHTEDSWGRVFQVTVDSRISKEHEDAKAELTRLVNEAEELKKEHQQSVSALRTQVERLDKLLPGLQQQADAAQKRVEDAASKSSREWNEFKVSNPVEFSQIDLLYNVAEYVEKLAVWTTRVCAELEPLEDSLSDLEESHSFHPQRLLPKIDSILDKVNDPNKSSVAFFHKVGERRLKRIMCPMLGNVEAAKSLLDDFSRTEKQCAALLALEASEATDGRPALEVN